MADEDKKVSLVLDGKVEGLLSAMLQGQKAVESGVGAMNSQFGLLTSGLGKVQGVLGIVTAALAGGALFKDTISTTKEVVGEVNKLSKTLGITAEQASVLRIAIDDAFLTVDDVTGGVNRLTRQLLSNEDAIKKLGVQTRDSNGNYRESIDIMLEVNSALSKIKAGTDQNVAGMSIYGKGWGEARNLMRLTSEAMVEARERAERLHLIFGAEGQAQMKEYRSAMKDLDDVAESMKVTIGRELIPALTSLSVAFGEAGASVADGFSSSLRESLRMMAEHSVALNNFFHRAGIIMNGGPLGTNWMTKSGRAEIKAELDAQEQMYQYSMEKIAERYGTSVKAVTTAKGGSRIPGGIGGTSAANSDSGFAGVSLDKLEQFMDGYFLALSGRETAISDASTSAFGFKASRYSNTALSWKPKKEKFSLLGGPSMGFDQDPQADMQARLDESSMLSTWSASREAARNAELSAEAQFYAVRDEMRGNSNALELLRIDEEQAMWEQSWAMQTDSFQTYEERMTQIAITMEQRRTQVRRGELQQQMSWTASGFNSMATVMDSFYQLTGKKSKAAFKAYQAAKSGETIVSTGSAAMKAYDAMASIPYVGPVLGAAAAAAAIAAGAVQLSNIWSANDDGGGAIGGIGGGEGAVASSQTVMQPVRNQEQSGQQIVIQVQGNIIGQDKWVEDHLAPTIRELVGRNVSFGLQPA